MLSKAVTLHVEGITVSGRLYLPDEKARYPVVCICHGIPASFPKFDNEGYPLLAERICQENFAVLIFNFRGTGASGGNFDILGWTRDLKAVIDYLCALPQVDKSHLSLLGFSGGAAVAIYVTSQDSRVSCVAACACPAEFTFITEVDEPQSVVEHFRGIGTIRDEGFPESAEEWLDGFRLVRPAECVAGIAPRPLLLVHGSGDETVDIHDAYRLYGKAGEPKHIIIVNGAGHGLRQDERAVAIAIDWLKSQCRQD